MDDIKKLAQEVIDYLDHGTEPYITRVSWLAFEAAPQLAHAVLEMSKELQSIRKQENVNKSIDK